MSVYLTALSNVTYAAATSNALDKEGRVSALAGIFLQRDDTVEHDLVIGTIRVHSL